MSGTSLKSTRNLPSFRPAKLSDAGFVLGLVRDFYRKSGGIYGIPFDSASTFQTINTTIVQGVCLVGPSSTAGAIFNFSPFNHSAVVAQVLFWFFKSAREIRILDEMKRACANAGATHLCCASHFPENRIGRHYERLSMKPIEQWHMTELEMACNPHRKE